ncbi:MAG TPA: hypothetical protein VG894_00415, partial [Bauldia sp.]|nr:hypothetical protein [Bauldia sp.]
ANRLADIAGAQRAAGVASIWVHRKNLRGIRRNRGADKLPQAGAKSACRPRIVKDTQGDSPNITDVAFSPLGLPLWFVALVKI